MKTTFHHLLLALAFILPGFVQAGDDSMAPDGEKAVELARRNDKDIAVFYHGGDWCKAGERVKKEIWDNAGFANGLKDNFVRLAIDEPEWLEANAAAKLLPLITDEAINSQAAGTQMVMAVSKAGALFSKQPDNSWMSDKNNNPAQDVYTIKFRIGGKAANLILIEALPDDTLPSRGPGRAGNGNFAVSEAELNTIGKEKVAFASAWVSRQEGDAGATQLIDGKIIPTDAQDGGWDSASGSNHNPAYMLLQPAKSLAAKTEYELQLHFPTNREQHTIGRIRLSTLSDDEAGKTVADYYKSKELQRHNRQFRGKSGNYPAIWLFDKQNLPYARFDGIWDRDAKSLADDIAKAVANRKARDAKWLEVEKANGVARAKLIGEGLDLMTLWDNGFNSKIDELKKYDPQDETGYLRKYTFNSGELAAAVNKLIEEKKFQEALDSLDRQINDPKNHLLKKGQIQDLILLKYGVYNRWPGHQDQRFNTLLEVIRIDPQSHQAIGARGYLRANGRGELAIHHNGWFTIHCKTGGEQTWEIETGAKVAFDHAGKYCLTLFHKNGKDTLTITSVELVADGKTVSTSKESKLVGPQAKSADFLLELPAWKPDTRLMLKIHYTATGTDSTGGFAVKPLLE